MRIGEAGTKGKRNYYQLEINKILHGMDAFCDENGNFNPDFPRAKWDVAFKDLTENAMVETVVTYKTLSDLDTVIQIGMQEGLTSTLARLDELLIKLNK